MKTLVVTPTLGESRWLDETVASVGALSVAHLHVLVCPFAARADLEKRFPQVQVVTDSGGGMYAAINAGMAAVREWDAVTYINDDDLLLPGFSSLARKLERAGALAAIGYGRVRLINEHGRRIGAIPVSPVPSLNRALYAQRIEPVYQHGTLISRGAMERLGGFDAGLKFCGDSELLARACAMGVPFIRAGDGAVAAFRLRPGQLSKNRPAMLEERRQVDVKLGLLTPQPAFHRAWAKFLFRTANLPVYVERIARHGFVSFDELLAQS